MEFRLNNDLAEIQWLAEAVEVFGEENGLPPKVVFQVNLALEELLTNTINYGYPQGSENELTIKLELKNSHDLIVEIRDDAFPFNPLEIEQPDIGQDIEARSIGGLGIHLVRQMMDEIEYCWENDHNVLVMRKHIKLA
jgi:serine/threonine-protein kinase RsbW